jgi:hypothetical protein
MARSSAAACMGDGIHPVRPYPPAAPAPTWAGWAVRGHTRVPAAPTPAVRADDDGRNWPPAHPPLAMRTEQA